jgi:hypothetical protein
VIGALLVDALESGSIVTFDSEVYVRTFTPDAAGQPLRNGWSRRAAAHARVERGWEEALLGLQADS